MSLQFKRRGFVKALVAAPVVPLAAQTVSDIPKLTVATAADAAEPMPHFFSAQQFAVLRSVSQAIIPDALDAKAPEFLDFLLSESPVERQTVYRAGLDALAAQAHARFRKNFEELAPAELDALLAPLNAAWTYELPAEPAAKFLHVAKQDVRLATLNSREHLASGTGRRAGGIGMYWYPLD